MKMFKVEKGPFGRTDRGAGVVAGDVVPGERTMGSVRKSLTPFDKSPGLRSVPPPLSVCRSGKTSFE